MRDLRIVIILFIMMFHVLARGQGSHPGAVKGVGLAPEFMAALDVAILLAEDELEAAQDSPLPPRFGYAIKVSLGLDSAGTSMELPSGRIYL